MHTDRHAYASTTEALNAITGPPGSFVQVFTNGDTADFHDGTVRERILAGDRLEALVLEITGGRRISIRFATVDCIVQSAPKEPS